VPPSDRRGLRGNTRTLPAHGPANVRSGHGQGPWPAETCAEEPWRAIESGRLAVSIKVVPNRLHFTGNQEADELIAHDPLALLIGFVLDQQVPLTKAFSSPLDLKRRLGSLDAAEIAGMDPAELERVFREKPALHRFPGNMAHRVQELCRAVVSEYDGRAERIWEEARDADDLRARLGALPGFGAMKVTALGSVLAKRYGVEAAQPLVPSHPTVGDIDSDETRERFQEAKRAYKAALRAKGS
jgi:uncharacterized HhH-GPD family protein